jgi:two-component system, NtrC family, response regulator AtoC
MENRDLNFTDSIEFPHPAVLVVDDDPLMRDELARLYSHNEYSVVALSSAEESLGRLKDENIDFVITEVKLPGIDGVQFISRIHQNYPELPVIVITGASDIQSAVDALKLGACDFVMKPFDPQAVLQSTRAALENTKSCREVRQLRHWLQDRYHFNDLLSQTPAMRRVFESIRMAAASDLALLIHGESGSGKELVARAVHHHSRRRAGPFVAVDCANLPEEPLERELWGFEKDAIAGARQAKSGKIAMAHGGTLFLDDIQRLSASMQGKLLRLLKDGEIQRPGSSQSLRIDLRIIAGVDTKDSVAEGFTSSDLYAGLNDLPIHLPPLRERPADIPLIVQNFLSHHLVAKSKRIVGVSNQVLQRLLEYSWPGNFRELQNVLERAILLAPGRIIDDVALAEAQKNPDKNSRDEKTGIPASTSLRLWLKEKEKLFLAQRLEDLSGNIGLTAKSCRIGVRTLSRKMRIYGLNKKSFKEKSVSGKEPYAKEQLDRRAFLPK